MEEKKIIISRVTHYGENKILMRFTFNAELQTLTKKIAGAKYTNTHKGWIIPDIPNAFSAVFKIFKGIAELDCSQLKKLDTTFVYDENYFLKPSIITVQEPEQLPLVNFPKEKTEKKLIHEIQITVKAFENKVRIFLKFNFNSLIIWKVKKMYDSKWDGGLRQWHVRDCIENREKIKSDLNLIVPEVSETELLILARMQEDTLKKKYEIKIAKPNYFEFPEELNQKIVKFRDKMVERRYAENTMQTYVETIKVFFSFMKAKPVDTITNEDVERFNKEYIAKKN